MSTVRRAAGWVVAGIAAVLGLVAASALLALASLGVFATAGNAWTTELPLAGARLHVSVAGLIRLATLPGVSQLLAGRSMDTRLGTLRLRRDADKLKVRCAPCRLQHPDLAPAPVVIGSIELALARQGDVLDGAISFDGVTVIFRGLMRSDRLDLTWTLASTELAALYGALKSAVPEAAYARIEGSVQANGSLSLPSLASRVQWQAEHLDVGGLGTEKLQYGWFRFACMQADGARRWTISGDGERPWVAADRAGPYLAAAVLAAEDQRFHEHGGFDPQAIAEILADLPQGRPRRGASTVTQQLARTLYTGKDRSAARKLREALYAIEMERTLGKARILELYLNTVDWGPGLCGVKAAARAYFNKSPARLTPIEAAWLAGVLRNPHAAWQQQFVSGQADAARAAQVLMQMREWPRRERSRWASQPIVFAAATKAKKARTVKPLIAAAPTGSAPLHRAGTAGGSINDP